jgi:transaldolase
LEFFIDTANIGEIRTAESWGVISGVTTNPSLVSRENGDFFEMLKSIAGLVNGPVSAEVTAPSADGMIGEARRLASIASNVVIKIPMIPEGMSVVRSLSRDGIPTNVTLVFSPQQALLAARAGATYVSPFVGRLDDIGEDGVGLVRDIAELFSIHDVDTRIIAASIRHPRHVFECALAGADIATVPFKVLEQCFFHPLTERGLESFMKDWNRYRANHGS